MDIQKYVTQNSEGKVEINQDAFKSAFDAEISRAVESFKNGKGKEEIRKQLEEEAKLSAEEKLQQAKADFEEYKKGEIVKLNQAKAKAKMEGKGFTEKEVDFILSTINDDETASLSKIDELVTERQQLIENTKKTAIEGLQQGQQKAGSIVVNPDGKNEQKAKDWTKNQILDYYRPQDKNN